MPGFMFGGFPTIFSIVFLLILGVFVVTIIRGLKEWNYNNNQPVLSVDAKVVSKRSHVSRRTHGHSGHHHHSTSTTYYVTFEVESGDRMELRVPTKEYGFLAEGDRGKVTFQGTRYHGFERRITPGN